MDEILSGLPREARVLDLGCGSGSFPASLKAVSEWFPQKERAFAVGVFNAGSNVGAIVTPLVVPAITLAWGWRAAFVVTGAEIGRAHV